MNAFTYHENEYIIIYFVFRRFFDIEVLPLSAFTQLREAQAKIY